MAWLEVETKVMLDKDQMPALRERIGQIADFEKKGQKADDYFAIKRKGYPKKAFRVRAMKGKFEVNFKKWLTRYWTKYVVVKQEFEFTLKRKDEVEDILALFKDLGYAEWVRKIKKNETYRHKKDERIEIEINNVKHLGYFMEIEYLCKPSELAMARRKIMNTLKELDINLDQVDNTGYTKMLWFKGTREKRKWLKF